MVARPDGKVNENSLRFARKRSLPYEISTARGWWPSWNQDRGPDHPAAAPEPPSPQQGRLDGPAQYHARRPGRRGDAGTRQCDVGTGDQSAGPESVKQPAL